MLKLKNAGFILVVVGLILGLMGTSLSASDAERLVIAVGVWAGERWETEIVPEFEKEYNVKVEVRIYPEDALQPKLLADALAGTFTHDVASIPYGYIRPFVEGKFLEDLTQYEGRFRESKVVPVKYHRCGTVFGVSLPWIDWVESLVVFRASRHKELALKLLEFAAVSEKPEQEEIKVSLESTTMILALAFYDRDNRNRLYKMITESKDPEGKLNLREFVDIMDYAALEEIISREELSNEVRILEKKIQKNLNMYFPVDEHRKRWLDQPDEMWGAYHPFWLDEKEIKGILAYDWGGNPHWLSPQVPPETPTLIVTRSERMPLEIEIKTGSRDTVYLVRFRIPSEDMFNRIEWGWFMGDAELYFLAVSNNMMYVKKHGLPNYKRDSAKEGIWVDYRERIDWVPERHTKAFYFFWWESDGNPIKGRVALEPYFNAVVDIPIMDDEAGIETIEYDFIPVDTTRSYSTGIVNWELYKTE